MHSLCFMTHYTMLHVTIPCYSIQINFIWIVPMNMVTKQLYRNKYILDINFKFINLSPMSKPELPSGKKEESDSKENPALSG